METNDRVGRELRDEAGDIRVEFTTTMRGRQVTCWLESGQLRGDPELLRRLARVVTGHETLEPATVARLVSEAVGSEVALQVRHPGDTTTIS